MSKHFVTSITYPLEMDNVIEKAKDRAKRDGRSFSAYVLDLLEKDLNEKKGEAQTDPLNLNRRNDLNQDLNDMIHVGIFTCSLDFKRQAQRILDNEFNIEKTAKAKDNFLICYQKAHIRNKRLIELKKKEEMVKQYER